MIKAGLQALQQSRFLRFCIVGAGGFVVDSGIFFLAHDMGAVNIYLARAISISCALTYSWWGNRNLTFNDRAATGMPAMFREWLAFVGVNGIGGLANYTMFAMLVRFAPTPFNHPYLALVLGTAVGLAFNFSLSQRLVFRDPPTH